ncbi:MAG: hypothetical protein HY253_15100 [Burkholderiales bacterium]|nr:hypothetical protein [Burkholderiales bacterium]
MKALINIWMQPVYARLNMDSRRSLFLLLALFPLGGELFSVMIYFGSKNSDAKLSIFFYGFLLSLAFALVIVLMAWFLLLVMNVGMQYSPANAAIVPGLKRRLLLALAIPVVVVSVLSVAITWFMTYRVTVFPAFVLITFFAFFVSATRFPLLTLPVILTFQLPAVFERSIPVNSDVASLFKYGLHFELLLFFASALMLWGVLHWYFSVRDEAHFKMHQRSLVMRQGMGASKTPANQRAAFFTSPYLYWMGRNIQRSAVSQNPNAKLSLAAFVTGPRSNWVTIFVQLVLSIGAGAAVIFLVKLFGSPKSKDFFSGFGVGLLVAVVVGLPIIFISNSFSVLYQTRTEQALFSLTPVVRDSRPMDGVLMAHLLRQFAILMGISSLLSFVLMSYCNDVKWINEFFILLLSALFVLALGLTHPFGKMKAISDHPLVKLMLILAALLLSGILMSIFISKQIAWWLSAAIVIVTSITLIFRLKRNAQTVQFPVGRAVS